MVEVDSLGKGQCAPNGPELPCIELGRVGETFTIEELAAVASGSHVLRISDRCRQSMEHSLRSLERMVQEGQLIYGLTTGFGPLAGHHISPIKTDQLQRNLVYHLAAGVGRPFNRVQTRAIMCVRAVSLAKGCSRVRPEALQLLLDCLECDLLPIIPSIGTAASGDLTPLAHLTLALFGEGEVIFKGDQVPATYAFGVAGLHPLAYEHREASAFVNGTSVMTAIAALNAYDAERALHLAMRNIVLYAELMEARVETFDPRLAEIRPHAGQQWATAELNRLCADSRRLQGRTARFLRPEMFRSSSVSSGNQAPQDSYTIRCAPQIFGAIADVLTFHKNIVEVELNSVTDNPIFVDDEVLHGGNFCGQHVAFASDALMTAVMQMAIHSEQRIARITDESQNRGLPAFLQVNQPGLHSGFMGAQATASAIVAEMRSKSVPASIQSVSASANGHDLVSMGTIAARRTAELIDHLYDLLAIEALVLVQGLDICDSLDGANFAKSSCKLALLVRDVSPFLAYDRPLHSDIANLSARLRTSAFF